jgi:hypothetical protein
MAARNPPVVGVFGAWEHACQAVGELRAAGFREDQLGIVARDDRLATHRRPDHAGTTWGEGAAAGAATGAGVGALWALGIAAGTLPALGPIIAGGLLTSILASAAGGAVVGGLVGALVGLGIPEEEALYYDSELRLGRTLVTVQTDGRRDEALAILRHHGAYDRSAAALASGLY